MEYAIYTFFRDIVGIGPFTFIAVEPDKTAEEKCEEKLKETCTGAEP